MNAIYTDLTSSIDEINQILPPSSPGGTYTPQEVALIRAYYLLCHAEIEYFLEKCIETKLNNVMRQFTASGTPHIILYSLTFHFIKTDDTIEKLKKKERLSNLINYLRSRYQENVLKNNNGLKDINLEKMLIPLGMRPEDVMSPTLIAELTTLGVRRGDFAHKSLTVHTLEDPAIARARTNIIIRDLAEFVRIFDSY